MRLLLVWPTSFLLYSLPDLALSLAETLAARGGADLDAIVIDEGFGSLDDDSLDVVASVLEDLSYADHEALLGT